jgi:DNA-binding CsgD family transcriptional regulator
MKKRGVMQLPPEMSLKAKQAAGASHAHANNSAKQSTREKIIQAAMALKVAGTPITQQSVAIRAELSPRTVRGYWNDVDSQLELYKKAA